MGREEDGAEGDANTVALLGVLGDLWISHVGWFAGRMSVNGSDVGLWLYKSGPWIRPIVDVFYFADRHYDI